MTDSEQRPPGLSRRRLLAWSGATGALGVVAGVVGDRATSDATDPVRRVAGEPAPEQAGQVTHDPSRPQGLAQRVPAFGYLLSVDLTDVVRGDPARARMAAASFLRRVSALADRGPGADRRGVAALDLGPSDLQITPGLGASLLTACGLDERRPAALVDLPAFDGERLDPSLCGGDLLVQVAAEDAMKVAGAVQQIGSYLGDDLRVRWSRSGFRATEAAEASPATTTRNLMGHRDGTDNPELGTPLWDSTVIARAPGWMAGGSYLVARRITIDLDRWFGETEADRDAVIGRRTSNGAALGSASEQAPVDLDRRAPRGALVVPPHAHIRLANARSADGARIYRRSWSFDDGWDAGRRHAGLMFLAWQADPRRGFVPIQRSLTAGHDALSAFTTHVGSAVFAVPARGSDEYVGQRLLEG